MIRYFNLENNKLVPATLFDVAQIVWADVQMPSDNEMLDLAVKFNVETEDLQDCIERTERPRFNYDHLRKNRLVLLRVPRMMEVDLLDTPTTPIGIFLTSDDKVITIQGSVHPQYENLADMVNRKPMANAWFLVIELFRVLSSHLYQFSLKISDSIQSMQDSIMESTTPADIKRSFKLNSQIIFFNTAILGDMNSIKAFYAKEMATFDADAVLHEEIDDVLTELQQTYEYSSIYRDLYRSNLDALTSVISNNLNIILKRLTSLSIIVAIPTLIASIYGMNVGLPGGVTGPEFLSFYVLMGICGLSVLVPLYVFRRAKWL